MTPEEAKRTIATIAWVRDSRREARTVISDSGSCEIRDCSYQNAVIRYYDQRASRLVYAEGLAASRCYVDFGSYTNKLALNFSGSRGTAEDLLNGLKYSFGVTGSKVILTSDSGTEFVFEVR